MPSSTLQYLPPYIFRFLCFLVFFFFLTNCQFWKFNESSQVEFGGNTTTFMPNTIKISVMIQNWPFYSLDNSLLVIFNANAATQNDQSCVDSYSTGNRDLEWITVSIGQVTLYPTFPFCYSFWKKTKCSLRF
jgi:hypothetical protein